MTKTNNTYYLYQFFGNLVFWTAIPIITNIAGAQTKPLSYDVLKFIKESMLTIVISHFVIRGYIKKNTHHFNNKFIRYTLLVIFAAAFHSLCDVIIRYIFDQPLPDNNELVLNYGWFGLYMMALIVTSFIYGLWLVFYLGISSNRDKKILLQQLTEQRLTSLMNQINPHFLFNSLNTIRGMIYENQDKAAELITQLSGLFRYNLASDTKGFTSLAKELEVCQQYLAIEHIRLGERLRVELNTSQTSLAMKIPTMGLLTLVENAVKHGIANLTTGGIVTIKSQVVSDYLQIEVTNPYQQELVNSGTKLGLANLKQRIELMFKPAGTLTQTSDNNMFKITIKIPCEIVENG